MAKTPTIKLSKAARTRGPDYEPPAPRTKAERRGPGRPSKYEEAVALATACALAAKGYTNVEIADEMGIHISTLYRYYADTQQFRDAVKGAKDVIDDRVQASLLQRATGYKQRVEKVFANGVRLQVIEEVQPDTTAQIFWLKNRRRAEFRDTREVDLVVPMQDGQSEEQTDVRQLALAALALFNEATEEVGRTTLDLTANEETEEGTGFDDAQSTDEAEAQEDGEAQPDEIEDLGPDFDI